MSSSPLQMIATLVAVTALMTAGAESSHAGKRGGGGGGRSFSGKSMGRSMNRSMGRSMNRSMGRSMNRSMGRSMNRSTGRSMNRSMNRSNGMSRGHNVMSRHSNNRSAMSRNLGGRSKSLKGGSFHHTNKPAVRNRATGQVNGRINQSFNKSFNNKLGGNRHRGQSVTGHNLGKNKFGKGTGKTPGRDHRFDRNVASKAHLANVKNKPNFDRKADSFKGRITKDLKNSNRLKDLTNDRRFTGLKDNRRFKDLKNNHRVKDLVGNGKRDFKFKDKLGDVAKHHLKDLHLKNKRGRISPIYNLIRDNHRRKNVCFDQKLWCHTKPKRCHWWYDWCKPIRYCEPAQFVTCSWNYVTTDYVVNDQVVVEDASWYLGLKAMLLPGQGVGIEEVAPGSPADQVGLAPGMVITRCNGTDLVDETALADVIAQSEGVLQMDLILADDGGPATCVVVMQRVAAQTY